MSAAAGRSIQSGPQRSPAGISLVATLLVVCMASSTLLSPFYPQWQEDWGLSTVVMTIVFAVYPLALLVTLLVAGSVSDHLGRRPVATAAMVILAIALGIFAVSGDAGMLLLGRVLQGISTGLAMTTLGAYSAELQPARMPGLAALVNAAAPTVGLALGAVLGGVVLDVWRDPVAVLFGVSAVISLVAAFTVWFLPETSPRIPGVARSLIPTVHVPAAARSTFARSVPAIAAAWATGGLFISLGASIVGRLFEESSHLLQGLTIGVIAGVGTVSVILMRRSSADAGFLVGTSTLAAGTILGVVAVTLHALPLYFVALALTGWGFGTAYAGALRLILPLAPAQERAGLFSAIYVVAYLAFGVPAVIAGIAIPIVGLEATAVGYGVLVVVAAVAATALRLHARGRGDDIASPHPGPA
ncbi:MFS transporter [Microbacterium caowuchunii]|uniref:MFS transporter n=1 Tax=Microbacterium caowuchunii TaxID=2614638 RepID=A0A5N0TH56_9MICO|nr:MFS transporter [Microbacterium caowuchunii]KAA9134425.1 MFS transporter [Microbacterium caowuchunii]